MARLNEPPIAPQPSADTIEAVKRRFLRQNRELAKTNSQQSIRIRSLENDCSRLLAENLSLREQVLQLHNTIESRPAFDHIDAIKTQLEAKIQELGGLVSGLAQLKKGDDGKTRRKSQLTARRRSGERQWRSGLCLQDVENGMLPTISEDKHYPRRTLGADELQDIMDDGDSQSPDIGPPPVSQFENEEPIAFDMNPATEERQGQSSEYQEPALSVNLETRKKRRESGPKLNIRRVSLFESPEEVEEGASKSTRTGSKRKFSVQEDEQKDSSKGEPFRFSRRNVPSASDEASNEEARPSSPGRPVLGSKPVNADPVVSPKKQRSSIQEKPEKPSLPLAKPRGRARLNITRNSSQPDFPVLLMPEPISSADIMLDSLPPKTPAVEDVFSPPSTEPSTQRPESKDTPPPGDLTASDQIGQSARPGRRARPQVSYKEPSLATKMRRPDAKLVDAVIERRTSVEPQASSTAVTHNENGEVSWKPVSAVSGRAPEEEVEIGSPLRQKLDRRETFQDAKTSALTPQPEPRSTTSKAISALISETSTAKRRMATDMATSTASQVLPETKSAIKPEEEKKDSLAVFDFTDSSPADTAANPRPRINELAKAARNARRHSAMPSATSSNTVADRSSEKPEGALPSLHKRTVSGSVKVSSATSLAKSSSLSRATDRERKPGVPSSGSTLSTKSRGDSVAEQKIGEANTSGTGTLRAERAASRRKSMLL